MSPDDLADLLRAIHDLDPDERIRVARTALTGVDTDDHIGVLHNLLSDVLPRVNNRHVLTMIRGDVDLRLQVLEQCEVRS